VLHCFHDTYTSRNTDHGGYWALPSPRCQGSCRLSSSIHPPSNRVLEKLGMERDPQLGAGDGGESVMYFQVSADQQP